MRRALYPAVVSTLGIMLAWLLWVAAHAYEKDPWGVVLPPALGAAVGFAVDFCTRLMRVARREAREGPSSRPAIPPEHRERIREERDFFGLGTVFVLAGTFLGGACTNLVGDMMMRLISPFLATIAIFFPVSLWLGAVFHDEHNTDSLPATVARGLVAGAGAGAIAFAISALLGLNTGTEILLGFFGWWGLLGIGWSLGFALEGRLRPLAPLAGTLLAGGLMTVSTSTLQGGGLSVLLRPLSDPLAAQAMRFPGLPAKFWDHSVEMHEGIHQADKADEGESELSAPAPLLTRKPPGPAAPVDKPRIQGIGEARPLVVTPPQTSTDKPLPLSAAADKVTSDIAAAERNWEKNEAASERSWLVLLLFSLSFGFGQWLQQRYLPREYERSDTRRNDRRLGIGALVLWLAACGSFLFRGWQ